MHGFSCHGHFAEYSLSDFRNAMVLPDGMDMVTAAPLFCAGVTGEYDISVYMFPVTAACMTILFAVSSCMC